MAVSIVRPPTAAAAPNEGFPGLKKVLKEEYATSRVFTLCHASHQTDSGSQPLSKPMVYSDEMKKVAAEIFKTLQQAARSGKTQATITVAPGTLYPTSAVLVFLQNKMSLKGHHLGNASLNQHSTLCRHRSVVLFWELKNLYLAPKPKLRLPAPPLWGLERLNEERREKKGDCELNFGSRRFSAHRLIAGSFSPVMAMQLKKAEEAHSNVVEFPEVKDVTPAALEALMTFMYLQKIDCGQLLLSDAIRLLELSFFFESPALKKLTFDHLNKTEDKMENRDILRLCFLQTQHPFEQLKQLCEWLLRIHPKFYRDLLQIDEMPSEELVMLFGVSSDFKIEALKEMFMKRWDKMTTAQKTAFAQAAMLKQGNRGLMEEIDSLCEDVIEVLNAADPATKSFVETFQSVHERVSKMRNGRPSSKK